MTDVHGWDWAWGKPVASEIFARGFRVALRYYAPEQDGKNLTPSEAWALSDAGLYIGTVYEHGPSCVGADAGTAAGLVARRQADACGQPDASCIYLAEDYDAPTSDWPAIAAALDAFAHVTQRWPGIYGKADLCAAMLADGHAHAAWQTAAWSHGVILPNAALYQNVAQAVISGVTGDINDVTSPFAGLWRLERAGDTATSPPEVPPMFSPPLTLRPIVAELNCPTGGVWLLGDDGGVYAFGAAPFRGGASGQPYFAGRHPAALELANTAEAAAGKLYTVVDVTGSRYSF